MTHNDSNSNPIVSIDPALQLRIERDKLVQSVNAAISELLAFRGESALKRLQQAVAAVPKFESGDFVRLTSSNSHAYTGAHFTVARRIGKDHYEVRRDAEQSPAFTTWEGCLERISEDEHLRRQ